MSADKTGKPAMKKLAWQALVIVLFGAGLGLAANLISPCGIPVVVRPTAGAPEKYLPLEQAAQWWRQGGALFLDAREPADFAAGHIGNALNLPAQSFAEHFWELAPLLTPDAVIVIYCDGSECELSGLLARRLREQGQTRVHVLFNGWTAWRAAGLPVTMGGRP